MKAAVYFLLLTSLAGISFINSTCFCSNETTEIDIYEFQSCPTTFFDMPLLPLICASDEPSKVFPVSLPLFTLDELLQQHLSTVADNDDVTDTPLAADSDDEFSSSSDNETVIDFAADSDVTANPASATVDIADELLDSSATADTCPHPFEDLMEYIYFINGSSINFDSFGDEEFAVNESSNADATDSADIPPTLDEMPKEFNIEDYNIIIELNEDIEVGEDNTVVIDFIGANEEVYFTINLEVVSEIEVADKNGSHVVGNDDEIEDEEDYTFEVVNDTVDDQPHDDTVDVNQSAENKIKRSRAMLRRMFIILTISVIGLISIFYLFILSIVVYVFLKDYFAEKFDAEANEHFRQLLLQIKNERQLCRPKQQLALPSTKTKKDQEQQTDAVEDEEKNADGELDYLTADEQIDECSSEVDVTMDDTTSHSCA
uniref:Uncharacterized protein n=1 Tax=Panagrolaimus sp. ES5 TaxID=591445 RepID=A0AC34FM66_9BILA